MLHLFPLHKFFGAIFDHQALLLFQGKPCWNLVGQCVIFKKLYRDRVLNTLFSRVYEPLCHRSPTRLGPPFLRVRVRVSGCPGAIPSSSPLTKWVITPPLINSHVLWSASKERGVCAAGSAVAERRPNHP